MAINSRDPNVMNAIEHVPLASLKKYGYISKDNPNKNLTFAAIIRDNYQHSNKTRSSRYVTLALLN